MCKKCICLISLVFLLGLLGMVDNASALTMRKGPYLIYPNNNAQMTVLWQLDGTSACTIDWGLDTSYSMGTANTTVYGDYQHKHTITGLAPGTKHFYRVTAGAIVKTGSFVTAPATNATSVKFMVYGDTRNNPSSHNAVNGRMIAEYTADSAYQSITLFSGDFVDMGRTETSWTADWFNTAQANMMTFQANVPISGSKGNHEIQVGTTDNGDLYGKYYPYTVVSPYYWSFDYGPAHILVIDQYAGGLSGSISAAQLAWIEADLAATVKEWKFLVFHAPGWTGSTRTNAQVQTAIQPLCVTYNVAIVFAGHEHFYTRCGVNGVKHITTGGGGAPLDVPSMGYPYVEVIAGVTHYCAVDIVGSTLYFKAVGSTGTVLDTFTIVHGPADTTPPTPNPMTWATVPYATSSMSIAMVATTATDVSGVEYYFDCTAGVGGHDSAWQSSTSYTDTGLNPSTQYTYKVKARDRSPALNETTLSTPASATTPAMVIPGKATNPNPTNGATGVGIYDVLFWTGHLEATSRDVYFGISASPPFIQNQTATVYDPVDMLSQTVYYWRINEKNAVGTTTGDLWSFTTGTASPPRSQYEFTGNYNNSITGPAATPYGNASIATDPEQGQCLSLDGTGDYIDCGYTAIANITTAMTLACWVKTSDFVSTDGIMTNGYSWKMAGGSGGVINFTNSTLSVTSFSGSIGISDGLWHHVAVTYDSVGQLLAIYVDGVLDASTGCTGVLNAWQGYRHLVGWCSSGASGYFTGLIDDARVYDRALPQPEIAILAGSEPPLPDTTPPTPNPMTWATVPYATGSSSIAMVATTATDISGVEYYFDETSGNPGGSDSAWQSSTSYTDTGLNPSTQYTYKVKARDKSSNLNETTLSTAASATTTAVDTTPPTPNPMTWATVPYATGSSSIAMVATTATDISGVEYYFDETTGNAGGSDSAWQSSTSYTDTGLSSNTQYTYQVKARDKSSNLNETTFSTAASATTTVAMPTFVAAGAVSSGTGTITPALPSGIAANDILLLFLETSNQAISITNQNGGTWTEVTNSPQYCGTAAGTTGARLTAFWSRYNGTQGAPTASDSGDHQLGRIIAIRSAVASGNPWDVTAGGVEAVSDTSGSIPGATTTVGNTLVVAAIATALPDKASTANFSSWTNANLTSVTECTDNAVNAGNGGGLGVATGIKATAGAYGNTAVTLANAAYKGMMSIAIKP